jgi:multiple sugar transport system ATP-binding protein
VRSQADPRLAVRDLTRTFRGSGGYRNLSLSILRGETLVVLGPSGAGKSSLITTLAGIDHASTGSIHVDGNDVTRHAPGARDVAVVFQDMPLYDHLSALENVSLAMSSLRLTAGQRTARLNDALAIVDITSIASRRAAALSGGERARVSIARVLARQPKVALLDEPYAAVDRIFRGALRTSVAEKLRSFGTATLHVTHDPIEANELADRVAIMIDGTIRQTGTMNEVRAAPAEVAVTALLKVEEEFDA